MICNIIPHMSHAVKIKYISLLSYTDLVYFLSYLRARDARGKRAGFTDYVLSYQYTFHLARVRGKSSEMVKARLAKKNVDENPQISSICCNMHDNLL